MNWSVIDTFKLKLQPSKTVTTLFEFQPQKTFFFTEKNDRTEQKLKAQKGNSPKHNKMYTRRARAVWCLFSKNRLAFCFNKKVNNISLV